MAYNAASRVRTIFDRAVSLNRASDVKTGGFGGFSTGNGGGSLGGGKPPLLAFDAWVMILDINEETDTGRSTALQKALALLHSEVEQILHEMHGTRYEPSLYEPQLSNALLSLDIKGINNQWSTQKQFIDGAAMTALGFCAATMESEGSPIPEETLAHLSSIVDELRSVIKESMLSQEARAFFLWIAHIMDRAIKDYRIVGRKAFTHAVVDISDIYEHKKNTTADYSDSKVSEVVNKWVNVAEQSIFAAASIATGHMALAQGLQHIRGYLASGSSFDER